MVPRKAQNSREIFCAVPILSVIEQRTCTTCWLEPSSVTPVFVLPGQPNVSMVLSMWSIFDFLPRSRGSVGIPKRLLTSSDSSPVGRFIEHDRSARGMKLFVARMKPVMLGGACSTPAIVLALARFSQYAARACLIPRAARARFICPSEHKLSNDVLRRITFFEHPTYFSTVLWMTVL